MIRNFFLTIILAAALNATADNIGALHLSDVDVNRGESRMTLNMTINPKDYKVRSNDVISLTPMIVSGCDTLLLPSVDILGKEAWYARMREGRNKTAYLYRAGDKTPVVYSQSVDADLRFDSSQIILRADTSSVCNCRPSRQGIMPIADLDFAPYSPALAYRYVAPEDSAEKIFDLSGRANIIFKVNRTEIDWSYANNRAELDTILRTIDVVRDNKDATVQSITLKGFASPEGSYANNVRLAKGRTEAVKDYVMRNSSFPSSIYHTAFVPEDWEGLAEWLSTHTIHRSAEMIAFIEDTSVPVEKKNDIFREKFPDQYPFLLANVYPSLRHTDYKITYKVRKYYDIEEIREAVKHNPRNLSLNELFLLANSCERGSEEYDEVFSLAARLYPDNAIANINAANSAINRRQFSEAARYLDHAGQSPDVEYARGILELAKGNLDGAGVYLTNALLQGVTEAEEALQEIERYRSHKGHITLR